MSDKIKIDISCYDRTIGIIVHDDITADEFVKLLKLQMLFIGYSDVLINRFFKEDE